MMKILDLVFSVIGQRVGNGMNSLPFQKVDHLASGGNRLSQDQKGKLGDELGGAGLFPDEQTQWLEPG